jgi:hypothetical protein
MRAPVVCVCVCVCERERESVCVCMRERERERERERVAPVSPLGRTPSPVSRSTPKASLHSIVASSMSCVRGGWIPAHKRIPEKRRGKIQRALFWRGSLQTRQALQRTGAPRAHRTRIPAHSDVNARAGIRVQRNFTIDTSAFWESPLRAAKYRCRVWLLQKACWCGIKGGLLRELLAVRGKRGAPRRGRLRAHE